MQLIEGPIHPHGDVQMIQFSILSDFIDHGRHPCAAQLSGTSGHCSTNLMNNEKALSFLQHRKQTVLKLYRSLEFRLGFHHSSISTFSATKPSVTQKLLQYVRKF